MDRQTELTKEQQYTAHVQQLLLAVVERSRDYSQLHTRAAGGRVGGAAPEADGAERAGYGAALRRGGSFSGAKDADG